MKAAKKLSGRTDRYLNKEWRGPASFQIFIFTMLFGIVVLGSVVMTRALNPILFADRDAFLKSSPLRIRPHKVHHLEYSSRLRHSAPDLVLEWHNFSSQTENIRQPSKRLLITQYSGFGKYEKLLNLTSPVNKLYAKAWGHDMLILRGTTKVLDFQMNLTTLPQEQSMYNKVDLLLMALENNQIYDQVLILDSDTLIYDFGVDLTKMVSSQNKNNMLVALRTHENDPPTTYRINNGVTLWNLHHPLSKTVALDWDKGCNKGIRANNTVRGDQFWLVEALREAGRRNSVRGVAEEFHYRSGTVVKHFIRLDSCTWHGSGMDERQEGIEQAKKEVARRFQIDLETQEFLNSTALFNMASFQEKQILNENQKMLPAINSSINMHAQNDLEFAEDTPGCQLKQKASWTFHPFYNKTTETNGTRLLIAQYTSFGDDDNYLNWTAPINALYAQKWNHDFLIVKGITFKTPFDGECAIPPKRSKYTKITILAKALEKIAKDNQLEYDELLMIDDGCMINDLYFDIRELSKGDDLILTARKSNMCDVEKTWNIKNDVTLWNLKHNKTDDLLKLWFNLIVRDLKAAKDNNHTASGDETNLQRAIKRSELSEHVRGLHQELDVIKTFSKRSQNDHFLWTGMDIHETEIKQAVESLCDRFPTDCKNLEAIPKASLLW